MAFVVHIGSQKTGSTAIQTMLAGNVEALVGRNFNYVAAGRKNIAHNVLAQELRHGDARIFLPDLQQEVSDAPDMDHIMSSEMLFHLPIAARLHGFLAPFLDQGIKLICYLRRHDHYLEAMYKQLLKNGKIRPDPDAFLQRRLSGAAYGPILDAFANKFGAQNLVVRAYDTSLFPDGDVVADFLSAVGIPEAGDLQWSRTGSNQTLSAEVSEILGEINRSTSINTRQILRNLIEDSKRDAASASDVFDPDTRADVVASLAEDAAYVADTYCADFARLHDAAQSDVISWPDAEARLERYRDALGDVLRAWGKRRG